MTQAETAYYRELVETAMLAGQIMISSGAETHRVEDTISRILKTTGFSQAEAFVLPTGITITLSDEKEETLSVTRRVLSGSNNLNRIYSVNDVSRKFCDGKITLDEAKSRLTDISSRHIYPVWIKILGTMLATGAFCILFGGSFWDSLAAVVCGIFLSLENYYLRRFIGRDFLCDVLCAATITAVAVVLSHVASLAGFSELHPQYIIVGSIMPLVPGVAITNAIRDVLLGDFLSSCARIVEAFMVAAGVAVGVGAGIFFGKEISLLTVDLGFNLAFTRFGAAGYIVGAAAAFLSIVGFSFILEVPKKFIAAASAVACVGWVMYLFCIYSGIEAIWSSFVAAALIEFLSYYLARILKSPVTLFLICGILPLVPGAGIYRAVYGMIFSDSSAGAALLETLTIAGAIALAIIVLDTLLNLLSKKRK